MVRKHKNGFTLVELLAVIVILAIILVIAVPQIMKTIDEARKGALSSSAKLIAASAEREYLARKTIGDTDFNPANVAMECSEVAETTTDYADCDITFTNGKAYITLVGDGKFKGKYVCNGTRESATVTETACSSGSGGEESGDEGETTQVALTVDPNGGTNIVEYNAKYTEGSTVTLTPPTAPEGKEFDKWEVTGTGASVEGNTLTMGTSATTVKAIWKDATATVPSAAEKITALANDVTTATTNGLISANGIRYVGNNPSNYIYFNCSDKNSSNKLYGEDGYSYASSCEVWRIIGVFDGRVKIIMDDFLESNMSFDNIAPYSNDWETSTLSEFLNKETDGGYYYSLSNEAKMQIGNKSTWYTGELVNGTINQLYESERNVLNGVQNYVGLIYPSDYAYAGTNCTGNNPLSNIACLNSNNWLALVGPFWTISPTAETENHSWMMFPQLEFNHSVVTTAYAIRPVIYLSQNVEIVGGDGTETVTTDGTGPYVIKKMNI